MIDFKYEGTRMKDSLWKLAVEILGGEPIDIHIAKCDICNEKRIGLLLFICNKEVTICDKCFVQSENDRI